MTSKYTVLGNAIQSLVARVVGMSQSFDKELRVDEEKLTECIDCYVAKRLNSYAAALSATAVLAQVDERLSSGFYDLNEILRKHVKGHWKIDGVRGLRQQYGADSVDVPEGVLVWEIVFELYTRAARKVVIVE